MNFTFTVPEGSMNHGNPNLLCTPAEWYDLIIFFFANYFAHAASVILEPGQGSASTGLYILLALTLPGAGVSRAIRAILRHAVTERKNPLKRAARAGALCMVLKKPKDGRYARLLRRQMQGGERPVEIEIGQTEEKTTETETETEQLATTTANQELDEVFAVANVDEERKEAQGNSMSEVFSTPSSDSPWWDPPGGYTPVPLATDIHGEHWLCDNSTYYLAMVPPIASMKLDFDAKKDGVVKQRPSNQPNAVIASSDNLPKLFIASSYNLPKLFIGFIQAIWAVITIYRTRGDQIQQYGYAAFGLTVAPYATMSILNTLANMLTPDYPCMFLIRTPMMNKAEEEGEGFFKGALRVKLQDENPVILPTDDSPSPPTSYEDKPLMTVCIAFFCSLIPLGIVGGLSGFQPGNSSQMERGFTMSWLVIGILYGLVYGFGDLTSIHATMRRGAKNNLGYTLLSYFFILLYIGAPMIGGMVVVGMMIRKFGICTLIG